MSFELWLIVAIGAVLALSLTVGLAVAVILARISEAADALMIDPFATALPGSDMAQADDLAP